MWEGGDVEAKLDWNGEVLTWLTSIQENRTLNVLEEREGRLGMAEAWISKVVVMAWKCRRGGPLWLRLRNY